MPTIAVVDQTRQVTVHVWVDEPDPRDVERLEFKACPYCHANKSGMYWAKLGSVARVMFPPVEAHHRGVLQPPCVLTAHDLTVMGVLYDRKKGPPRSRTFRQQRWTPVPEQLTLEL